MKKISALLMLLCSIGLVSKAQDVLRFTNTGGRVTCSGCQGRSVYTPTLTLVFDGLTFRQQSIRFFSDTNCNTLLCKAVFEKDIKKGRDGKYTIVVSATDGITIGNRKCNLPGGHFAFNLNFDRGNVQGPFVLQGGSSGGGGNTNPVVADDPVSRGIDLGTAGPATAYTPGHMYYDAFRIKQDLLAAGNSEIPVILKAYGITGDSMLQATPFLNDVIGSSAFGARVQSGSDASSFISGLGDINVTNFADGIAKFLVARSKEELNVTFFERLNAFLRQYPEAATLFPNTSNFINNISSYEYAAMLPALRSGFQSDLIDLAGNMVKLRDLTPACCTDAACSTRIATITTFMNGQPAGRALTGTLIMANDLVNGQNAAAAINDLANDRVCDTRDNLSAAILFANLVSQSLVSTEAGHVWVSRAQVSALVNDPIAFKLYLGLMYARDRQNAVQVAFNAGGTSVTLQGLLRKLRNTWMTAQADMTMVNNFKRQFLTMANAASDASGIALRMSNPQNVPDANTYISYGQYMSGLAGFITQVMNFLPANSPLEARLVKLKADLAVLTQAADAAFACADDIKSRNYGALVLHSSDLFTAMLGSNYTFKDGYIKYGTFMANVAAATTSDEVQAALDAAVLPAGSASIKRETSFNIAINGYIGGSVGREYLPALPDKKWGTAFGVAAPVGVAFSWGKIKCDTARSVGGKSVSLFVSLIDVGALAYFRMQDNASNVASEVQLKNIIAPGLFGLWGFGKVPVSAGFGFQLGPQLRSVSGNANVLSDNYYLRASLNVLVDIPFFNLYAKTDD